MVVVIFVLQNILLRKDEDGGMSAVVADFGLACKIPR